MASTLETVLIVDLVKRALDCEKCVPISGTLLTGGVTADDCDDGVTAECVDTVEQLVRNTVSSESQHLSSLLVPVQISQALLVPNIILMMDVSVTSTVHHQRVSPAVLVSL